jgi:hypothetical protein
MTPANRESDVVMCARCACELLLGTDSSYRVTIEAVADPSSPRISAEDLQRDLQEEIRALLRRLENYSEQEAMDQVHRRLVVYFCQRCYVQWIEDPAGRAAQLD